MSDENQAEKDLVELNRLLHYIDAAATHRKSLTAAEEAEFTASAYSMNYATCSPQVRDMASKLMLVGTRAASSTVLLTSLARELIRISDENETQAEPKPRRIELLCEYADYRAIMESIRERRHSMGMPDAKRCYEDGAIIAEICRGYERSCFDET